MEDMDCEQVLRVPVADHSTHTPSVRMDLRGCTPRHLQAISDFIDACHSKAGAGKVIMPTSFPSLTLSLKLLFLWWTMLWLEGARYRWLLAHHPE